MSFLYVYSASNNTEQGVVNDELGSPKINSDNNLLPFVAKVQDT